MKLNLGDGVTYRAELFRVQGNRYKRLVKRGHGYVSQLINDELVYVWNGVRHALVHRKDITINHNNKP